MTGLVHLTADGTSLLLDARGPALPVVVHWGAALPAGTDLEAVAVAALPAVANSALDVAVPVSLVPARSAGYRGRPGLSGHREGRDFSPDFALGEVTADGTSVVVTAADEAAGLGLVSELTLEPSGVLWLGHTLTNRGEGDYSLSELAVTLPVPDVATGLLDLTGRWLRERHPQRQPFPLGAFVRESRHGRTGHDAPLLLAAGTAGFGNRRGQVWAVHLGWSGDSTTWAERMPDRHAVLGAAELLAPGEAVLRPGESYRTPETYAAYSAVGLDGIGDAFHRHLRARPTHPRSPRPVVLNTWEAVYFDHDLEHLLALADTAARIGVERFVLDDGWFHARRDDTAGLGDWVVDTDVWPEGLAPLIDGVTALGMAFGLWVEPEMVNLDSDLYRAHPDWVLGVPGRLPPSWRGQQVLDLTAPGAYAHVLGQLDALLTGNDIAYLKWDHNRDLVEAADLRGHAAVHAQTLATYRLLDELRSRHPHVEIESCASGGARVDLGVLQRTDRVWASDTNDALERQSIQRWTSLLLPPELVGAHVGPPMAHTTGRTGHLSFRVATALFGHFGFEWDVSRLGDSELALLTGAVAAYKRLRPTLHTGSVVHADLADDSAMLHGVVSADGSEAVYSFVQLTTSAFEVPGAVPLPGLRPDTRYAVRPLPLAGPVHTTARAAPPWWDAGLLEQTGAALEVVGVRMPVLDPEQAVLLELTALPTR